MHDPSKILQAQKQASLHLLNNKRTYEQKLRTLSKTASHKITSLPVNEWLILENMKDKYIEDKEAIRESLLEKNAGLKEMAGSLKDKIKNFGGFGKTVKKEIDPMTGSLKKLEVTEGKTQRGYLEQLALQVGGSVGAGVILNKMYNNRTPSNVHIHLDNRDPNVQRALLSDRMETSHSLPSANTSLDPNHKSASIDSMIDKIPAVSKKVVGETAGLLGFAAKKSLHGVKNLTSSGAKKLGDITRDHYEMKNLEGIY